MAFLKIILILILSWVLIHFLGLFGVFLALAYPIWWIFFPNQIPCLYCRTHADNEKCPFCGQIINKEEGIGPKSIKSVFLNILLILLISMISIGFIYVESRMLTKMGIVSTQKTAILDLSEGGEYKVGESFPLKIAVSDIQTEINAFQIDIKFNPKIVEVTKIASEESFANIIVQKEINNELGYVRYSGGLPNPGHNGPTANLGTIYFKGKSSGVTEVEFLPKSMILANDGKGTNILKGLNKVSYIIIPADPDEVFPEISKIFEDDRLYEANKEGTKLDFSTDSKVLGSSESVEETAPTRVKSLNPFMWLGYLDGVILDLWRFR